MKSLTKHKKRTELELAEDRQVLANIKRRNPGATSGQLAVLFEEETGRKIAPRTVRYDLQQLLKQLALETRREMELVRVEELGRIDIVEQEAWDAWRHSMESAEKVVTERLHKAINDGARAKLAGELARGLADKNEYVNREVVEAIIRDALEESLDSGDDSETFVHKVTTTVEARVGDPRFLKLIHEAQVERRKILGVYAPEMHDIRVSKIELKGYAGGWSPDNWKSDDSNGENGIIDAEFTDAEAEESARNLLGDGSED